MAIRVHRLPSCRLHFVGNESIRYCGSRLDHHSVNTGLTPGYTGFALFKITYRCRKVSMEFFARLTLLGVVCRKVAIVAVS